MFPNLWANPGTASCMKRPKQRLATALQAHRQHRMDTKGVGIRSDRLQRGWAWVAGLAGAIAASGVLGQTTGLFTFPYVDAHGRGIPGVTRPMLMAGPGLMGMGMGGGMGVPVVNPNWTGAAAMFAPELLMGRGMMPALGGAMGGSVNGASSVVPGGWGRTSHGQPSATRGLPEVAASRRGTNRPGLRGAVAPTPLGPADAAADARLLAFQQAEARKGLPGAQRALANRYEKGVGVERSEELARAWRLAADRAEAAAGLR